MRSLKHCQEQGLVPWKDEILDLGDVMVFRDGFPVTAGHLLFVPKFDAPNWRRSALGFADLYGQCLVKNGVCQGYNIGLNQESAAGQTVMYPHVHLIPRYQDDHPDPVGGVRAVIPGQANYKKPGYKNPTDK